jgi:hypothetical protein
MQHFYQFNRQISAWRESQHQFDALCYLMAGIAAPLVCHGHRKGQTARERPENSFGKFLGFLDRSNVCLLQLRHGKRILLTHVCAC